MKTSQAHADTERSPLWERIRKLEYDNNAAAARISRLEDTILECREFIDPFADIMDGDGGPRPNRAMTLVSMIDEALATSSRNVPGKQGKDFPEKGKEFPPGSMVPSHHQTPEAS